MRGRAFTGIFASFALLSAACAAIAPARAADGTLGATADVTYASKYMIDGFKIGGDNPVWEPSLSYDLFSTGFSVMAWAAVQINRANRQYDELDLFARYSHDLFAREWYELNLHGFGDYWFYPNKTTVSDGYGGSLELPTIKGNKVGAGTALNRLVPLFGSFLVPTYDAYYWFYWAQNRRDQYQGGAHHELGLHYYHDIPRLIPGVVEQYVGVAGSGNYHDGAFSVSPGWSHATLQLSTGVYALGGLFSASVNRQWSYIASVDATDEFWTSMSFTRRF